MLTLPALGIIWSMFELPALCEANITNGRGGVDHFKVKAISKIQLVVYYQYCVLIGGATTRLYVIAYK